MKSDQRQLRAGRRVGATARAATPWTPAFLVTVFGEVADPASCRVELGRALRPVDFYPSRELAGDPDGMSESEIVASHAAKLDREENFPMRLGFIVNFKKPGEADSNDTEATPICRRPNRAHCDDLTADSKWSRTAGNRLYGLSVALNLVRVHRFTEEHAQAMQFLLRALEISVNGGDISLELITRSELSPMGSDPGNAGDALSTFSVAARLSAPIGRGPSAKGYRWDLLSILIEQKTRSPPYRRGSEQQEEETSDWFRRPLNSLRDPPELKDAMKDQDHSHRSAAISERLHHRSRYRSRGN